MKTKRFPTGYLAEILTRIREIQKNTGDSFSRASWRVCFFEECGRNKISARNLERRLLRHMKREKRQGKPCKVGVVQFRKKTATEDWQQRLERCLGIPFELILGGAMAHEIAIDPHVD